MPELERQSKGVYGKGNKSRLPSPGPYLAIVTNHLDTTYMGALEVSLIQSGQGTLSLQSQTFVVNYLSPFGGNTSIFFEGTNSADFNDVQKSYGFWAVPPDIGTTVMCLFVDGDPNSGYWFGCVWDKFQNHMVPGLAASKNVEMTPEQERKYGTRYVPVAEFHKASRKDLVLGGGQSVRLPNQFNKPIHPFADRLLAQGLLTDTIRGVTSSGARREVPSSVFGISTPGPLDTSVPKKELKYNGETVRMHVSRLGGHTFVMDDGDKDGQNELVRIRTRTGHQILLHDSQDLIYIANAKGTAWLEMTSNGKIDIYAEDSISIHSKQDFNFRADRDINFEAGRDVNIGVGAAFQMDVVDGYFLMCNGVGQQTFSGNYDLNVEGDMKFTVGGDSHYATGGSMFLTSLAQINMISADALVVGAGGSINLKTNANANYTAAGTTSIKSGGQHLETASQIHMNGPEAASASDAVAAKAASIPQALPKYFLPNREKDAGWNDGKFYKAADLESIMKRVPTHEPWDQHENINVTQFSPANTDVGTAPPSREDTSSPAKSQEPAPNLNRADVPSDWVKDDKFIAKVVEVAKALNCSYIDLLACMAFETGRTFSPAIQNSIGATGLIQFIRPTAIALGTTTTQLAAMSRVEQMDYVLKYFKAGPVAKLSSPSLEDLYMGILWPKAVGKPNDYILFTKGSRAYAQNPLDKTNKGYVTKADAAAKVRDQINYVRTQLLKATTPGGEVTDSSGKPILDGDGKPVRYGPYPPTK